MDDKIIEQAAALSKAASAQGTFNIVNVLAERGYPREEVKVFLDEQTAYALVRTDKQIDDLEENASSDVEEFAAEAQAEQAMLVDYRTKLFEKLQESLYVFHIVGIAEGVREKLITESFEKFPQEFNEDRNIMGEVTRTPKENVERDTYITSLIWQKSIEKIVSPDGSVQQGVTHEDVAAMAESLPVSAATKITNSIDKLRLSTALFLLEVNEDFLAKP
jgi:hypothetical protein